MIDINEMTEEDCQKREQALADLAEAGETMREAVRQYETENNAWWEGLSETEREKAFYAVCKRIYQGDFKENRSYRGVLYGIFGFDPGMYAAGIDCGYMAIHNAIFDGEKLAKMNSVTRFEVIDDTGRAYVKYLNKGEGIKYSLQDDDRTLKVFIDNQRWKDDL